MRAIMTIGRVYVVLGALAVIASALQQRFFPSNFPSGHAVSFIAGIIMLLPTRRLAGSVMFLYVVVARSLVVVWFSYWATYAATSGFTSVSLFGNIILIAALVFVGPSVVALVLLVSERRRLTTAAT